jgi:hypothetical protein
MVFNSLEPAIGDGFRFQLIELPLGQEFRQAIDKTDRQSNRFGGFAIFTCAFGTTRARTATASTGHSDSLD